MTPQTKAPPPHPFPAPPVSAAHSAQRMLHPDLYVEARSPHKLNKGMKTMNTIDKEEVRNGCS